MGCQLILMRHAQSMWNQRNLFTGWVDVPLSTKGIEEALRAGELLAHLPIDLIIVSNLMRAQMTAMLAMSSHASGKVPVLLHTGEGLLETQERIHNATTEAETIPVFKTAALNERMYGELQGLNKAETMKKFGEEQVKLWRRSYDIPPPGGESLEMTAERSIPYFKETVIPLLDKGLNIFICAHGNSLRSIMMFLDGLTKEEVLHLELETGVPIIYTYSNSSFSKKS